MKAKSDKSLILTIYKPGIEIGISSSRYLLPCPDPGIYLSKN